MISLSVQVARVLLSRSSVCVLNFIILTVTVSALYEASKLLFNVTNDFDQIEGLLGGPSAIFVAYGVALEERDYLMQFFKLYPTYWNHSEEAVDRACHFYGLCVLLLGLFMEVSVEVLKIPNNLLNTQGHEGVIFGVGLLFSAVTSVLLMRLSYVLLRVRTVTSKEARAS
jgi:Mn2+/Fe2+ NRAMP family transporter